MSNFSLISSKMYAEFVDLLIVVEADHKNDAIKERNDLLPCQRNRLCQKL